MCETNPLFITLSPVASVFPLSQHVCQPTAANSTEIAVQCSLDHIHPLSRLAFISELGLSFNATDSEMIQACLAQNVLPGCDSVLTPGATDQLNPIYPDCTCGQNCSGCNWQPGADGTTCGSIMADFGFILQRGHRM